MGLPVLYPLLVLVTCLLAYAGSFGVPFLFDDNSAILDNPHVRHLWPLSSSAWAPSDLPVSGRPIVSLSLAVNYAIGGYDVIGYHVFNLLIHACNALLVFGILHRSLGRPGLAVAVSLIWAVHPLGTEAVVYVVQRTELLVSCFMLLALYATTRGWHVLAVFSGVFAVLCKEVAVVLPLIVLLYDRTFLSGSFRAAFSKHRFLHVGLFGGWILLALLQFAASRGRSVGFDLEVAWYDYLLTQGGVILWYLRLSLVPVGMSLAHDWPIAGNLLPALPVAVLLATVVFCVVRAPRIGFLGMWFFLILAPTSSILPIVSEVAAERRMYLPLLALVVPLAFVGRKLPSWAGVALTVALVGTLGTLTRVRVEQYQTTISIWEDALAKNPRSTTALNNLARAYEAAGRVAEAQQHYEKAIEVDPEDPVPRSNLGSLLARHNDLEGARQQLLKAHDLDPGDASPMVNLGNIASTQRKWTEAERWYRAAISKDPNRVSAHVNLAFALASERRFDEATRSIREAQRLDPQNEQLRKHMATLRDLEAKGNDR